MTRSSLSRRNLTLEIWNSVEGAVAEVYVVGGWQWVVYDPIPMIDWYPCDSVMGTAAAVGVAGVPK